MDTELVSEKLVSNLEFTWLIARENFIAFIRREHFQSYIDNLAVF